MIIQLKALFESLNNKSVRYLLCGGLAVNLYGIPRMTADIDLIIDWDEKNVELFEDVLKENRFKSNFFFHFKNS